MQQGKTKAMLNAKKYYESKNPGRVVTAMLDFNQVYVVSSYDKKNPDDVNFDGLQAINKETKEIRAFMPSALNNPDAYFNAVKNYVSFEEENSK